jgi:hypothetical protein
MIRPDELSAIAPRAVAFQSWFNTILTLGALAFLGVLAVRNLRLGRGDRRSAFRLSVFVSAIGLIGSVLSRHWTLASGTADPYLLRASRESGPMRQVFGTFGPVLFLALAIWLAYVGFEPHVRRRWPHLLIASTRLLDGRWRDPLVGRSVLVGLLGGTATLVITLASVNVVHWLGLGTVVPSVAPGALDGLAAYAAFVATVISIYLFVALLYLAVLLLARLVLRSTVAAWIGLAAVFLVMYAAWSRVVIGPSPAVIAIFGAGLTAGSVIVLWRGGLLALAVWLFVVTLLRDTPWTFTLTGWAAWPMWFATILLAALAFWGFRNVLGRQSAFPAES